MDQSCSLNLREGVKLQPTKRMMRLLMHESWVAFFKPLNNLFKLKLRIYNIPPKEFDGTVTVDAFIFPEFEAICVDINKPWQSCENVKGWKSIHVETKLTVCQVASCLWKSWKHPSSRWRSVSQKQFVFSIKKEPRKILKALKKESFQKKADMKS